MARLHRLKPSSSRPSAMARLHRLSAQYHEKGWTPWTHLEERSTSRGFGLLAGQLRRRVKRQVCVHHKVYMTFGMCNAPATFQRLIEIVLAGLLWKNCFAYIDDLLICFQEHLEHLHEVLARLRKAGLRLKAKKCLFLRKEVPYLGYVVTDEGIKPDTAKTDKIRLFLPV